MYEFYCSIEYYRVFYVSVWENLLYGILHIYFPINALFHNTGKKFLKKIF